MKKTTLTRISKIAIAIGFSLVISAIAINPARADVTMAIMAMGITGAHITTHTEVVT